MYLDGDHVAYYTGMRARYLAWMSAWNERDDMPRDTQRMSDSSNQREMLDGH
jgi:hypothetical protein